MGHSKYDEVKPKSLWSLCPISDAVKLKRQLILVCFSQQKVENGYHQFLTNEKRCVESVLQNMFFILLFSQNGK